MTGTTPAPARFREIASGARALADAIGLAHAGLRGADVEYVRRAGFRLDDAAGQARSIAGELEATAADLDRFYARPADACQIPWGICPEHGNTLTGTGGQASCRVCGRVWDYDRLSLPCEEPARWMLADAHGAAVRVCDGHAADARERLDGARLTPVTSGELREDTR
jgi:hypothetical protein